MRRIDVKDFNLKYTLECGQFFRYKKNEDVYLVNHKDILFMVKQEGNRLHFSKNVDKEFIIKFFRLDDDLNKIYNLISTDEFLKDAINEYRGLRLIQQDPWECLISFICSSASNIPKIQKNVELLSQFFGRGIACKNHNSYSFPKVNSIIKFELIQEAKTGFRAKYIQKVNNIVSEEYFDYIKGLDYENAKKELVKLPGVGEKIADCVLLFSLNHLESFPIDTWINKVMKQIYKTDKPKDYAINTWGMYAGYAQQYMFMKMRSDEKIGKK